MGASDTSLGKSALADKLGLNEFEGNEAMRRGAAYEPIVLSLIKQQGLSVRRSQALIASTVWPDMSATLDGFCKVPAPGTWARTKFQDFLRYGQDWTEYQIDTALADTRLAALEIKTAAEGKLDEWQDLAPLKYWKQCQHQMAVTGLQTAWLVGFIGEYSKFNLIAHRIERDDKFIQKRADACAEFMGKVRKAKNGK